MLMTVGLSTAIDASGLKYVANGVKLRSKRAKEILQVPRLST